MKGPRITVGERGKTSPSISVGCECTSAHRYPLCPCNRKRTGKKRVVSAVVQLKVIDTAATAAKRVQRERSALPMLVVSHGLPPAAARPATESAVLTVKLMAALYKRAISIEITLSKRRRAREWRSFAGSGWVGWRRLRIRGGPSSGWLFFGRRGRLDPRGRFEIGRSCRRRRH